MIFLSFSMFFLMTMLSFSIQKIMKFYFKSQCVINGYLHKYVELRRKDSYGLFLLQFHKREGTGRYNGKVNIKVLIYGGEYTTFCNTQLKPWHQTRLARFCQQ